MMYLENGDKKTCCGCGACAQACPLHCISMKEDRDGFLFPVIDQMRCIDCGLCRKVCPFESQQDVPLSCETPVMIAATAKDDSMILRSASGGAFECIVRALCEGKEQYAIWGAAFDENLQVRHICCTSLDQIAPLKKSKYVQSDIQDAYAQIKQQLQSGCYVIFSGTPCQVAALRNYLRKTDTTLLFCIDLVCHGVPSQKSFNAYLQEEEQRLGSRIISYTFRHKVQSHSGVWNSRCIQIKTENGNVYEHNRFQNRFLRAYHAFIHYRESCHACIFANEVRQGDVTIADFWGIQKLIPDLNVDHGVSLIQFNSEKAFQIKSLLTQWMVVYSIDRERYLSMTHGAMRQPTPVSKNRDRFFACWRSGSFSKAVDQTVPYWKTWIKVQIASRLSPDQRKKLKKLIRRK